MPDVDIVISGGGVVGMALALACERFGASSMLLSVPTKHSTKGALGFDLRTIALSPQSVSWLSSLDGMGSPPRQRVDRMHIWEQLGTSTIDFTRDEVGTEALAWIFEHEAVAGHLHRAVAASAVQIEAATITEVDRTQQRVTLSTGKTVSCELLVIAEGPNSTTRTLVGTQWDVQRLSQHAIVTVIRTEEPHCSTAWQRFGNGILALLPLSEPKTHAIVWSVPSSMFQELQSKTDDQFKSILTSTSDRICGTVLEVDQRLSFPLTHGLARTFLPLPWVFIVGDAAHTVHPLAGQGMNLGLEDARALESVLRAQIVHSQSAQSELSVLAARRRAKAIIMQQIMTFFDKTWQWDNVFFHWCRNFGVRMFSSVPAIKKQVIREAMGLGPMTAVQ